MAEIQLGGSEVRALPYRGVTQPFSARRVSEPLISSASRHLSRTSESLAQYTSTYLSIWEPACCPLSSSPLLYIPALF